MPLSPHTDMLGVDYWRTCELQVQTTEFTPISTAFRELTIIIALTSSPSFLLEFTMALINGDYRIFSPMTNAQGKQLRVSINAEHELQLDANSEVRMLPNHLLAINLAAFY